MIHQTFKRRTPLARLAAGAATLTTALLLAACGDASAPAPGTVDATGDAEAGPLKVGFIYVGPKDDYGYNQAHAEGKAAVAELDGVEVIEEEKVPETLAVQKSMESMINLDGVKVLFPTSFGYYDPHVKEVAAKHPGVLFFHCGGLYKDGDPENAGSYFGYIDEGQYLNGIAAGHATKTGKIGFVAAKPVPQVVRNINAFTLGARSVNPEITCTVVFTGDWSLPVQEKEAAQRLIDGGADVLSSHVDSPKIVVQTAAENNVFVTGYHTDQSDLAPEAYLIGAEWNWPDVYTTLVQKVQNNELTPGGDFEHMLRGGLKEGFVKMSDYGPGVSDAAQEAIEAVKTQMMDGSFVIFAGPMSDNEGNEVIPADTDHPQTDPVLEEMGWLVEGVIGSTGG